VAVRLRLRRIGKKKMPMYQIVAADSRAARNGKFLEVIGRYEPRQDPMLIATNETRVFHWLKNGALPTDTVRSLFQRNGLWVKWTLTKQGADPAKIASELEKFQMAQAEKRRHDEERRSRRHASRKKVKKEEGAPAAAPAAAPVPPAAAPAAAPVAAPAAAPAVAPVAAPAAAPAAAPVAAPVAAPAAAPVAAPAVAPAAAPAPSGDTPAGT
jgi:small subunit ribosomal protein S16